MPFSVEVEKEEDGRWLSEIPELAAVLACGTRREEAIAWAQVLADRSEQEEPVPATGN